MATGAFIAASTLIGAGVGGVVSKASGGDFWKGALVGGLTGAVSGGVGAFTGIGAAAGSSSVLSGITGATTTTAALKAGGVAALKTAMLAGTVTGVANATGITKKKTSTTSLSDIEKQADEDYSTAAVKAMTVSELQQGNQNILGTFGNTTSQYSRARLLNA